MVRYIRSFFPLTAKKGQCRYCEKIAADALRDIDKQRWQDIGYDVYAQYSQSGGASESRLFDIDVVFY